jgi:hydroxymethylglutaryl-CoA lyase
VILNKSKADYQIPPLGGGGASIIECPRDAMQGWKKMIPTEKKIDYINALLQVGFDTIDFGSFVSPKAIPQMADTVDVLKGLQLENSTSKLLAIVANQRGATDAVIFDEIKYLGFPFSISPTFQLRNTNSTIAQSIETVTDIQELCIKNNKQLVVYLSMAFGNPYEDDYNEEILLQYADTIKNLGIKTISLADTVGVATPIQITTALHNLIPTYTNIEFGVHLHTSATNWKEKLQAATDAGCRRIDGAINGIGGCPMADDVLVGNLATENIMSHLKEQHNTPNINQEAFDNAVLLAKKIFI